MQNIFYGQSSVLCVKQSGVHKDKKATLQSSRTSKPTWDYWPYELAPSVWVATEIIFRFLNLLQSSCTFLAWRKITFDNIHFSISTGNIYIFLVLFIELKERNIDLLFHVFIHSQPILVRALTKDQTHKPGASRDTRINCAAWPGLNR